MNPLDLLPVVLPSYCEREVFGAEPVNTLSNASFWLAAAIGWWRWRTAQSGFVVFAVVMLVLVGACSALWHWFRLPWLLPVDSIPLYVLVVGVSYRAFALTAGRRYALSVVAIAVLAAVVANAATVGTVLHVPSRHGAALLVLGAAMIPLRTRAGHAWPWLIGALALYAVAMVGKILDAPLCGSMPVGMHWLWHTSGGAAAGIGAHAVWLADVGMAKR